MRWIRRASIGFLVAVALACVLAHRIAPAGYAQQFRDMPDSASSQEHPLGTDSLGRDRLGRLLQGTQISLLLAPAAALVASLLAGLIGGTAGFAGGWLERGMMAVTDLFLSLPWLFLLMTVRAMLPLNISPFVSVIITFLLIGTLGWAAPARVVCANARAVRNADFILLARASGVHGPRLVWRHLLPNLRPVLLAQFWLSIPLFILTEANLGILGLGVSEPLPSWGSLLRDLESYSSWTGRPWQFVPLVLMVATVAAFHVALQEKEPSL